MRSIANGTIIEQLSWRYATKKFDPTRALDPADWKTLEQALVLAPSSFGLQPWRFFVVNDPAVRAELRPAAFNQPQITDASHLVVFAVKKDLDPAHVERHIARIAAVRGVPVESLEEYKQRILGVFRRPPEEVHAWAVRQVYLALGTFLTAAALLEVDACPMEGFDPARFDEILGLDARGYSAVVLAPVGYRAPDDPYAKLAKVRFSTEELVVELPGSSAPARTED